MTLRDVDRGQGSEGPYLNQVPDLLTELANRARAASIIASSALEGVVVKNRSRAAAIIANKPIELRTRSEQELAGYRAALDNLVVDRSTDGGQTVRFMPVPAARTEYYVQPPIESRSARASGGVFRGRCL